MIELARKSSGQLRLLCAKRRLGTINGVCTMLTFLIRRFTSMIFVVALISVLGFILIELPPGSALDTKIAQMRQSGGEISQEQINALEDLYGLRDPIHVKYTKWITRAVTGDFGQSFTMDMPVAEIGRAHV